VLAQVKWYREGACVSGDADMKLALIAAIFCLFAADGRAASLKPIRPLIIALVLVQLLQPVVLLVGMRIAGAAGSTCCCRRAIPGRCRMATLSSAPRPSPIW
jgi:hypothetical protein